jgi:dTDP-4-dehydrorhamnose 3,5-epimerase-like enzyme
MRFQLLPIQGVVQVDVEAVADARGSFARLHCEREFEGQLAAWCVSVCRTRGSEAKARHALAVATVAEGAVRCIRGAIHDVVIDLDRFSYVRAACRN